MRSIPWFVLAGLGAVVCIVAAALDWGLFAHAWLAATLTWGLLPIGALAALMTMKLTGGGWGDLSRPAWRALAACMPLIVLALLPLLFFAREALFPWTRPVEELPEVVRHKLLYLNEPFLIGRTLGFFAIWLLLAFFMGVWSRRRGGRALSAGGLVALLYTLSFFAFDWFLSLEPKFYTDVFGLWVGVTAPGGAAALVIFALRGLDDDASVARRADLANLWLSVQLGWALMAFSQFIIIWSGNLPHEIEWYVHRGNGFWLVLIWLVFFLFFATPFVGLLFRSVKESGRALMWLAGIALLGYVLQVQWWILPAAEHPLQLIWYAPACVVTLGGLLIGVWLILMRHQEVAGERA